MSEQPSSEPTRIVLVVGVDLSDVSEHLRLTKARDLVRTVDIAELHVVHVVRPEPLRERLSEPVLSPGGTRDEGPAGVGSLGGSNACARRSSANPEPSGPSTSLWGPPRTRSPAWRASSTQTSS